MDLRLNLVRFAARIGAAWFVFASTLALAQEQRPLTWEDCVRMAAMRNPDLRSALEASEASRAQYFGSYNGILPQVSFIHSYTDSSASRTESPKLWLAQGAASLDL